MCRRVLSIILLSALACVCACKRVGPPPAPPVRTAEPPVEESITQRENVRSAEPEGFARARGDAAKLNSSFLIDEPPYRYYACGYVVLTFPARPETLEKNREQCIKLEWSAEEFESQLANSRELWRRIGEIEGISSPDELMSLLLKRTDELASRDNEDLWKEKFRLAFEEFRSGRFAGRENPHR